MGVEWGKIGGSLVAGVEQGLNNLFGVKPDGFFRNRYNPTTRQLEGVRADGTAFAISPNEMTQDQLLKLQDDRRRQETGEADRRAKEAAAFHQRNTIAGIRETAVPQLTAIQQQGAIALKTLTQHGENAALDRAAIREQNEKIWQLRAQELGISDKNQQLMYAFKQQELADARSQYADTLAMRKEQMAFDRETAKKQALMRGFALLAQGIGASF